MLNFLQNAFSVPDLIPIKTAKTMAAEEKVLTPARRSQRIRSNTSVLSMTPEPEEKITPSRRTTRAKSNTSLVSEVTSTTTPRAKRAARRNSQISEFFSIYYLFLSLTAPTNGLNGLKYQEIPWIC